MRTLVAIGSFVIFAVLTVVLLKHQRHEIPRRDVYTSLLLYVSSFVASMVSMSLSRRNKKIEATAKAKQPTTSTSSDASSTTTSRPAEFTHTSNQLMQYEVLFTLLLPWILLRSSSFIHKYWQLPSGLVEHLLVPHLYFFQTQIGAEAILFASHQDDLLFPYTCVANALRALPLASWILRSLVAVQTVLQFYNPFHWLLLVALPATAAALWLYSSLVFIPLIWYPVLHQQQNEAEVGSRYKPLY